MAIAEDLDRATDSQWDWVAGHTRKYLGGTESHESNGVAHPRARYDRTPGRYASPHLADLRHLAHRGSVRLDARWCRQSRSGCQGVNIGLEIAGTDQSRSIDVN
jgi:hypothetical protein